MNTSNHAPQTTLTPSLTDVELKRAVKRLNKIDEHILAEYAKEECIEKTASYWVDFYSGKAVSPTKRCEQLMRGIKSRTQKLNAEQTKLFKKMTRQQAIDFGYCVDGMDENSFLLQ